MVSLPSSNEATVARGSIGRASRRGLSLAPEMTMSQSANRFSSGFSTGIRRQVLEPASSNSRTSSLTTSRMSVIAGSGSYST